MSQLLKGKKYISDKNLKSYPKKVKLNQLTGKITRAHVRTSTTSESTPRVLLEHYQSGKNAEHSKNCQVRIEFYQHLLRSFYTKNI